MTLSLVPSNHKALHRRCSEVTASTPDVAQLVEAMVALMRESKGIGLAAPQVGYPMRLAVIDVRAAMRADGRVHADSTPPYLALINPILTPVAMSPKRVALEGCLSLPDYHVPVERWERITYSTSIFDENKEVRYGGSASGMVARAIQHEVDHLDGIMINSLLRGLTEKQAAKKGYRLGDTYRTRIG